MYIVNHMAADGQISSGTDNRVLEGMLPETAH